VFFSLGTILIADQLQKNCGAVCLENLARRLDTVVATIGNPSAFYIQFKGLLMEVVVAVQAFANGWTILNFSQPYKDITEIDIIARRSISGIGDVVAYIEVKSDKYLKAEDITRKLSNYADYIKNIGRAIYQGDFHVAVFISYEYLSPATAQHALLDYNKTTPALIIYCVANCNGFGEGIFYILFKNMTPEQAVAIATALGFQIYLGTVPEAGDNPNPDQGYYFTGDPTLVMLLLMTWTMR